MCDVSVWSLKLEFGQWEKTEFQFKTPYRNIIHLLPVI